MDNKNSPSAWSTYSRTVFIAFTAIALALVAYEHRVHVLGVLPWLLILICPLMHVVMHHGHGHGGHPGHDHAGHRLGAAQQKTKETRDV
ncbi:DUF2933 family protein [Neorhizobium sp. R1-B]|uniref:DUF2933 domain-containing protein n=1 Tax=unclassified Neorhizobium TaxID=2629175 RepID=UPI000DD9F668|nr:MULTISPECIES: DUF2933 domain-containing protein [unclassified Neorhizobium]TCV65536.1 DUF2933 family protein [Neorhizobium sp. S3-V5DH]TDX77211.1 DUF2933 family protein [Neorhizobium sp. R1-B]